MKIKLSNILYILFSVIVILNNNSVLLWRSDVDLHLSELAIISEILLLVYIVEQKGLSKAILKSLLSKNIIYFSLIILYFIISVSMSQKIGFFLRFFIFMPVIWVIALKSEDDQRGNKLFLLYSDTIIVIACISLFFWLFGSVLSIIHPTNQIAVGWHSGTIALNNYNSYLGLYYEFQNTVVKGVTLYRNCALFCEAPMYAIVLTTSLIVELFIRKRKNSFKILILFLTTLSTFSSLGVLCFIIAYLFDYYIKVSSRGRSIKKLIVPVLVLAGIALGLAILEQKSNTNSWVIRIRSWNAAWRVFKENPIWGDGYLNTTNIMDYSRDVYGQSAGVSNSLPAILAQGGILLGYIYFYPIIKTIIGSLKKKDKNFLAFTCIFTIAFIFTAVQSSYCILMFISYFYLYIFKNYKLGGMI